MTLSTAVAMYMPNTDSQTVTNHRGSELPEVTRSAKAVRPTAFHTMPNQICAFSASVAWCLMKGSFWPSVSRRAKAAKTGMTNSARCGSTASAGSSGLSGGVPSHREPSHHHTWPSAARYQPGRALAVSCPPPSVMVKVCQRHDETIAGGSRLQQSGPQQRGGEVRHALIRSRPAARSDAARPHSGMSGRRGIHEYASHGYSWSHVCLLFRDSSPPFSLTALG